MQRSHRRTGLRSRSGCPIAETARTFEPFTTWTAPVFAGHPGVGARLIQKDQPLKLPAHGLLSTAPVMPCFSNLWLAALPGDQAFFICVAMFICVTMATQQRVDTACRAPHVMGCQKGGPQFNQGDVGIMLDQLHEERDKRLRFAAPLARHRRQGLNKSILPAAAARTPPSIRFLKRTRRAIESAFPMAHPSTQDESQDVNSGNPQSIHPSMETL